MANTLMLAWDDLVPIGTVTVSSEVPSLPGTNLQHPFVTPNKWRALDEDVWMKVDLGASHSIRVIALVGTNLTAAAVGRVRVSENADLSAPDYDTGASPVSLAVDTDYKALILVLPPGTAGRYVQIEVDDSSLAYVEIGRWFMADAFSPSRGYAPTLRWNFRDTTAITYSESGQAWIDRGVTADELNISLHALSDSEVNTSIRAIAQQAKGRDFLVILNTASSNLGRDSLFGTVDQAVSIDHYAPDLNRLELTIVERL